MILRILPTIVALAPVGAALVSAPTNAAPIATAQRQVLSAEDARFRAQIARDIPALERALADDLIYTHASGKRQTKRDYLDALKTGFAYRSIAPAQREVRVSGDLATTRATLTLVVGDRTLLCSYLAVYIHRAGRWQLLTWQTSPAPSDGGPPAPASAPAIRTGGE